MSRAPAPPAGPGDLGLYVHFPYCEQKCPYCDFNSHAVAFDDDAYTEAVLRELSGRAPEFVRRFGAFSTIYFGGGTPSLWAATSVAKVIQRTREDFGLAAGAEITLEANPGTVHERSFGAYLEAGVNRLSIGAQSFDDEELVSLGRIHGSDQAERAVRSAKNAGARVSLDLIYGLPGQGETAALRSVERALALEPDHVSAYTLTIEPETVLGRQYAQGRFVPADPDEVGELIELVTDALTDHGYDRYEVSSYAPPGKEAVHNSLYWLGGGYLGLGAGAHSYRFDEGLERGTRRGNIKSPQEYVERSRDDHAPAFEEHLDKDKLVFERLLLAPRTRWGFDPGGLDREAGLGGALMSALEGPIAELIGDGLLERIGPRVVPTARGFLFADLLSRRLTDAAEEGLASPSKP